MKLVPQYLRVNAHVAPHAGAWIETAGGGGAIPASMVAPHAGAWIETLFLSLLLPRTKVAPHAGAWIETIVDCDRRLPSGSRPPCGGVD